ncbi:Uncharacterised protein [Mycobacteroides abscessus subsp. abscessus]|nr:Uncharacterised protein [Mycobacteroides abscessus subsp. abscessus]
MRAETLAIVRTEKPLMSMGKMKAMTMSQAEKNHPTIMVRLQSVSSSRIISI